MIEIDLGPSVVTFRRCDIGDVVVMRILTSENASTSRTAEGYSAVMPGECGALVNHMLLERGHYLGASHSRIEIVDDNEHDVMLRGRNVFSPGNAREGTQCREEERRAEHLSEGAIETE